MAEMSVAAPLPPPNEPPPEFADLPANVKVYQYGMLVPKHGRSMTTIIFSNAIYIDTYL